jgi:hypothetical protein
VEVSAETAALLALLLFERWRPEGPAFLRPVRVSVGAAEISPKAFQISRAPRHLICLGEGDPAPGDESLEVAFEDGRTLRTTGSLSIVRPLRGLIRLVASSWSMLPSQGAPSLWVAQVRGRVRIDGGNLAVVGESKARDGAGAAFQGSYDYYLLNAEDRKRPWLVVDTKRSGVPDLDLLTTELRAIQFALGANLAVDTLYGVEQGRTVAHAGRPMGRRPFRYTHLGRPVPQPWRGPFWPSLLFRCLTRTGEESSARRHLYLPLSYYLDAMDDHLDGQSLRLHIGMEAFAKHLSTPKPALLVKDADEWKMWVKEVTDAIRERATVEGFDTLIQKVSNAFQPPSGRLVEGALAELGVTIPPDC